MGLVYIIHDMLCTIGYIKIVQSCKKYKNIGSQGSSLYSGISFPAKWLHVRLVGCNKYF